MASTMHAWSRRRTRGRWPPTLAALLLLLLPVAPLTADNMLLQRAEVVERDGLLLLNADVELLLGEEILEALHSGVPLTLLVETEVTRRRAWWWDEGVAFTSHSHTIAFHALSRRYLVRRKASGEQFNHATLAGAVASLGQLRDLSLVERDQLLPDAVYDVRLRARLDIEALPTPLRPLAYISPAWRLMSGWHTVPITLAWPEEEALSP